MLYTIYSTDTDRKGKWERGENDFKIHLLLKTLYIEIKNKTETGGP